MTTCSLVCG